MTWPFENDTSAVEKKLATRSMKADKRRSIFVIITIALAVCLMGTLCFVYSSEQLQTLEHIQDSIRLAVVVLPMQRLKSLQRLEDLKNGDIPQIMETFAIKMVF